MYSNMNIFKIITIYTLIMGIHAQTHQKIPIREVEALTLQFDKMTAGRRSSPIAQLTCRGMNCALAPSSVRCINVGHDGNDVQWDCNSVLDKSIKFGIMNVQCEGYDYPEDPNILVGSCGLDYTLEKTGVPTPTPSPSRSPAPPSFGEDFIEPDFITIVIVTAVVWVAISSCCGLFLDTESSNYSPRYRSSRYRSSSYDSSPGFWTGAATGYMAGSSSGWGSGSGGGWGSGSGSSGGGWGSSMSTGFATTSRR